MLLDRYHSLGASGLRVSPLCLGTMTFGTEWGWGADKTTSWKLFSQYLDAGGNFIDTADIYTVGSSETLLGQFIQRSRSRDRVVLASKFGFNLDEGNPNAGGNGRKNIMRAVEGSLSRLRTDYLDLYILHAWDRLTPVEEVIRALDDLVRAGKVRYVGLSNTPAWYASRMQTLAELRGHERICSLQLEYSLLERNIEHEFLPMATELGMSVTAWSPLGSGLLSGKYRPSEAGPSGVGRLAQMQGDDHPMMVKLREPRVWPIVRELETVADAVGRSMAEVALNWTANRPGVASVIIGATTPPQLRANLRALDFDLPEELRQRLDEVSAPTRPYPYTFFEERVQNDLRGGVKIRRPRSAADEFG